MTDSEKTSAVAMEAAGRIVPNLKNSAALGYGDDLIKDNVAAIIRAAITEATAEVVAERDAIQQHLDICNKDGFIALRQRHEARRAAGELLVEASNLLVWTYQYAIDKERTEGNWLVTDLHPSVWNAMNAAEQKLYHVCKKHATYAPEEPQG